MVEAAINVEDSEHLALASLGQARSSKKRMRHINNERQRRMLMNTLLDSLQSLLPDAHPRKDRCTLLTEVIEYIHSLEREIAQLEERTEEIKRLKTTVKSTASPNSNQMMSGMFTSSSEDSTVSLCLRNWHVEFVTPKHLLFQNSSTSMTVDSHEGLEEFIITFSSISTRGLLPHVLQIFQQNLIDIIAATVSTTDNLQFLFYIHVKVRIHCTTFSLFGLSTFYIVNNQVQLRV
ncbi:hypothetical protein KP509_22G015600 [Ceratopteris richardii]|uniref:BHLH domain-containing protein n=1 Tax=Ceratopteris richardii TaxID=49495 RepID=A0A8T2S2V9_CERRI|nr:hypothetical protein KP509_22G015600 [Ceratopteris richardii]